jgi:hypothetical protein
VRQCLCVWCVRLCLFKCIIAHVTLSILTIVSVPFNYRSVEFRVYLLCLGCLCCFNLRAHPFSPSDTLSLFSPTPSLLLPFAGGSFACPAPHHHQEVPAEPVHMPMVHSLSMGRHFYAQPNSSSFRWQESKAFYGADGALTHPLSALSAGSSM